jgi:protein translocase SecG subunit
MLSILHIILALALSLSITLQQRATGLSATFGGSGGSYVQRRGAEALLFQSSVYLSLAFFALGIARMFLE